MTVDLFRPFMSDKARQFVQETLTPQGDGRLYIGEGDRVAEFEQEFAATTGNGPILALNSCTSAIDLALELCGVGVNQHPSWRDEVITTPMTCTATNTHIVLRGAVPVWADVDPITGLIDPADVARKITPKTRAIIAVDWGGRRCDYEQLTAIVPPIGRSKSIPVIQDAAHNPLASGGDYVCYSFQAIKHLTTGDGGALLCTPEQQERARLLRWYGLDRTKGESFRCSQDIREAGFKYHMNDIAASIGLGNLPDLHRIIQAHWANAEYLLDKLAGTPGITLPPRDESSSWWLFTILTDQRDSLAQWLTARGVGASQVHSRNDKHTAFTFPNGPLPGVDAFASRELAIPVGWWLSEEDVDRVVIAVREWAYAHAAVTA